jgi:hypothetical protein
VSEVLHVLINPLHMPLHVYHHLHLQMSSPSLSYWPKVSQIGQDLHLHALLSAPHVIYLRGCFVSWYLAHCFPHSKYSLKILIQLVLWQASDTSQVENSLKCSSKPVLNDGEALICSTCQFLGYKHSQQYLI